VHGPKYDDIRALGMGNTSVAVTTDRTAIFHNPAGLSLLKDSIQFSITPLAVSIDGILFTILDQMAKQGGKLGDMNRIDSNFMDVIYRYDGQWVDFSYMPEITITGKNMGFGSYTVLPIGASIESGHFIPKLLLRGQQDIVFTWGVGFPLRHENNRCGISIAYFQRTPLTNKMTTYTETFILFNDLKNRPLGVIGDYAEVKHGASFTLGFMHDFRGIRFAWDLKDLPGIVGGELVFPPRLDLGCSYYFPHLEKAKFIKNCIVAGEISNLFGVEPTTGRYEQFFKKIHLGGELDLKYAALRLGISQGYPTFGFGIRYGMFKADYAYFTEELGYFAGQWPSKRHVVSFGIELSAARQKQRQAELQATDLYNRAMGLYTQADYFNAFFLFGKLYVDFPHFFKNDQVELYMGMCQEYLDMREAAANTYLRTKIDYPASPVVPHADLGLLRLHYRDGNDGAVANQFSALPKGTVPDSLYYHACYYQGQAFIRAGEYRAAADLFSLIPSGHPEYAFGRHSLAVALAALSDTTGAMVSALDDVINSTPTTKAQEEIINRSFVLLGYIHYDGLGGRNRLLSKAVAALTKVPPISYYYGDALVGLAWCYFSAGQQADCDRVCTMLRDAHTSPLLQCEAMLLQAYIDMTQKNYTHSVSVLREAEERMMSAARPSAEEKSALDLENRKNRGDYFNIAAEMNDLAHMSQSGSSYARIDSLQPAQALIEKKLRSYTAFVDEYTRKSFFAKDAEKLRGEIEYMLAKAEKLSRESAITQSIKEVNNKTDRIDHTIEGLQQQLDSLGPGRGTTDSAAQK
jgi:tetratricopeptide (TPR) repeat protein